MTADLLNPSSVLHRLSFSASLPVLIAMCMPDCPRPVQEEWLSFRIGRGEDTVRKSLKYLQKELHLVFSVFIPAATKPIKAWWLSTEVQQLPLPFVGSLGTGDTRPFTVIESIHLQELPLPVTIPDDAVKPSPLDEKDNPKMSAYLLGETGQKQKDNPTLSGYLLPEAVPKDVITSGGDLPHSYARECASAPGDLDLDRSSLNLDLKDLKRSDQIVEDNPTFSGYLLAKWLGINETTALQFQDVEPVRPLALYWFGTVLKATTNYFRDPVSYVIKHRKSTHIEDNQQPYFQLAEAWLRMDTAQRQMMLDYAHEVRGLARLAECGYFIPYREWSLVCRATNGRVAPPELMPQRESRDNDEEGETAVALPENVGTPTLRPENPIQESEAIWQAALSELELQMTKATFNTWLKGARLVAIEGDTDGERVFVVSVKNDYAKDWIENRLIDTITRTASAIASQRLEFRFIVSVN